MKKYMIALITAVILSLPVTAGEAVDNCTVLNEANAAFTEAGKLQNSDPEKSKTLYSKAARRYEKLIGEGIANGQLHYNLGNCYFWLNQPGKAILEYKRAEQYTPHDPNLQRNLAHARSMTRDHIPENETEKIMNTVLFWHYDISTGTRRTVFGIFFILFWAGMAVRLLRKKTPPTSILAICAFIWVCLLGSLIAEPLEIAANREGVITSAEVTARKGNGLNYQPSFTKPLHEGTEFKLLEKRSDWLNVELDDGRRCWLPASDAELVRK